MTNPHHSPTDGQLDEQLDARVDELAREIDEVDEELDRARAALADGHQLVGDNGPVVSDRAKDDDTDIDDPDIDDQVVEMLGDVEQALPAPTPAPTPYPTMAEADDVSDLIDDSPAANIEDLDSELASLAADLLEGDFDDVDAVLSGQPEAARPVPQAGRPEPEPAGAIAEAPAAPALTLTEAADDDPAPADNTMDQPAAAIADDPAAAPAPRRVAASPPAPAKPRTRVAHALLSRASSGVHRLAQAASRPLDTAPAYTRDVIGWVAAVTLFNAAAVWVFYLVIREPQTPPATDPAVGLAVTAAESQPADELAADQP